MKKIAIFGVSGSIGRQAIQVIQQNSELFCLKAVSIHTNLEYLFSLLKDFSTIERVGVGNVHQAIQIKERYPSIQIYIGKEGLTKLLENLKLDLAINSIVGFVGLYATQAILSAKCDFALANKESLVVAGELIKKHLHSSGCKLFPIDSEHSAIWQCLSGENNKSIKRLLLTASGGPFRTLCLDQLKTVTVEQALNHPTWKMGRKITIDSATLVNKGLEIIEAHYIFDVDYDHIEVVIHPQSIIHSLVEFCDHSIKAQLGLPSMIIPIQYALNYPHRCNNIERSLEFNNLELQLFKIDLKRFKSVRLAYQAGKTGYSMPLVYNTSNEVAVEAFLNKEIKFDFIEKVIEKCMDMHKLEESMNFEQIYLLDQEIRIQAREVILEEIKNGSNI